MKSGLVIAVALLAVACSSASGGGSPSLDGTWYYVNAAGTAGIGATFNQDGSYVAEDLALTSSTSANVRAEKGTFSVSGNAITLTPKESSCPGPDPIYHLSYSFQGSNLELAEPSGGVVLQPDTQTASNAAITFGCFDSSGNFTPEPLAAVSN